LTSYFQDGGRDVISRRNVPPSDECTRSVRQLPATACLPCSIGGAENVRRENDGREIDRPICRDMKMQE